MALNFPNSPIDGQSYYDVSSGNRYVYDSANTIWKYAANNSLAGSANSQILFNNEGSIDGSDALVFEANTLYPQEIVVTQNATATYYFGNGAFLTGISATGVSDLTPANNWANTLYSYSLISSNASANSANAYALTLYTSALQNANNDANAANIYAMVYANTISNNSNTFANTKLANATTTLAGSLTLTGTLTFVGNSAIFSNTLVTSAATSQILDSFTTTTWRSAMYVVTMTAGTDYHITQVSLVHDGTNAFITEFGTISTANNLGLFDANIVSGTVRLNVVPTFAVTTINLIRTTNK